MDKVWIHYQMLDYVEDNLCFEVMESFMKVQDV